jgi:hypothetical protein
METFQDYLRKTQAYNAQRAINGPIVDTNDPYGSPELLSSYMEGQSASEARSRGLAIQERNQRTAEKQVEGQKRAELYQLGALGTGLGIYGLMNAEKIGRGYNYMTGASEPVATPAVTGSTAAGAETFGDAGVGQSAITGSEAMTPEVATEAGTTATGSGIGGAIATAAPFAAAAYLDTRNTHRLGENLTFHTGSEQTQKTVGGTAKGAATGAAIGSVVPGVGTVIGAGIGAGIGALSQTGVGHTLSKTWKKITGWF